MFDIAFELILQFIKMLGWYIPIFIALTYVSDLVRLGDK